MTIQTKAGNNMTLSKPLKLVTASIFIIPTLGFSASSTYLAEILMSDGRLKYADVSRFHIELDDPNAVLTLPAVYSGQIEDIRPTNDVQIDSITIQPSDSSQPYIKWELKKVTIADYAVSGNADGVAVEEVVLNYEALEIDYPDRRDSYICAKDSCELETDSGPNFEKVKVVYTVQEEDHSN